MPCPKLLDAAFRLPVAWLPAPHALYTERGGLLPEAFREGIRLLPGADAYLPVDVPPAAHALGMRRDGLLSVAFRGGKGLKTGGSFFPLGLRKHEMCTVIQTAGPACHLHWYFSL